MAMRHHRLPPTQRIRQGIGEVAPQRAFTGRRDDQPAIERDGVVELLAAAKADGEEIAAPKAHALPRM